MGAGLRHVYQELQDCIKKIRRKWKDGACSTRKQAAGDRLV